MAEDPKLSPAAESARRFREAIDGLRKNADLSAKALAALGTSALSLFAINKFADVFPIRTSAVPIVVAVIGLAGFFAIAGALVAFTIRIWRINAPVFMNPSREQVLEAAEKDRKDQKAAARAVKYFDNTARLNGAPSLEAYAARGRRLERVADGMRDDDPRRARLLVQVQEIRDDVDATMAHAAADIVRTRSRDVVVGPWMKRLSAIFIIGLVAVALSVDYLESDRSGSITVAKECAAAGKALGEQVVADRGLPPICDVKAQAGAGPTANERALAVADACVATIKASKEQGLDTSKLTASGGACPAAPKQSGTTRQPSAKEAALADLLTQTGTCVLDKGPTECRELFELVALARD